MVMLAILFRHGAKKLTGIIPTNRRLHNSLHPVPQNRLLIRAEKVGLIVVVVDTEPISSRVHVLVHGDLVPNDIDIPLDLRLLKVSSVNSDTEQAKSTNRRTSTLQAIHMLPLEDEVPVLPRIVPVPPLAHVPHMIRLTNLLEDTLPRLEWRKSIHNLGHILPSNRRGSSTGPGAMRRRSLAEDRNTVLLPQLSWFLHREVLRRHRLFVLLLVLLFLLLRRLVLGTLPRSRRTTSGRTWSTTANPWKMERLVLVLILVLIPFLSTNLLLSTINVVSYTDQ